jgi:hypothetical protein
LATLALAMPLASWANGGGGLWLCTKVSSTTSGPLNWDKWTSSPEGITICKLKKKWNKNNQIEE